ncbi:hypothetical protein BH10PSE7_BH10PSE7_28830 [soil metagenome]
MSGVARNFFGLSLIYAICGLLLGLQMAISQDHGQMVTHAHIMLAGFMMSAVMAYFYHLFPARAEILLAKVHFWVAAASGIALTIGLFILFQGVPAAEPLAAGGSIVFFGAFLLFAWIAIPVLRRR